MDEKIPNCKKCFMPHYNFRDCPPRQDVKPSIRWADKDLWGNLLGELKYNGGNTFLNKREGDR